jgi:hypothetical protein
VARSVPDRLREEALHEILARLDVRGSEIAAHPAANENAWLLGQATLREVSMLEDVEMVGARGVKPSQPT